MAKQDVLEAINATIVPNGAKAISAQALNNVLTMMTENAGEGGGSGDGALRVMVPELMVIGPAILDMGELTPESWATLKSEIEREEGFDVSAYDAVVNASFAHNATVVQQIIEKGKAGQGVSVVLDQTPYFQAAVDSQFQLMPDVSDIYEEILFCGVQPAGLYVEHMNLSPEGEALLGGDMFAYWLAPTGNINLDGTEVNYPSNMQILLNLDGSLTFTVLEEEQPSSVTFYVPVDNNELTSKYKAKNAASFSSFRHGVPTTIVAMDGEEPLTTIIPTSILSNDDSILLGALQGTNDGFSMATIEVSSNGSATIQK